MSICLWTRTYGLFSATGALDRQAANARFDHMMTFSLKLAFSKRAIIEASTASLIGYVGVDEFEFSGESRLEFGYRLVRASRGYGYATEAASAILEVASQAWQGELLAFIDPHNGASRNVLIKTGFEFVEHIVINGDRAELYSRSISRSLRLDPAWPLTGATSVRCGWPHQGVIAGYLLSIEVDLVENDLAPAKPHVLDSVVCIYDLAGAIAQRVIENDTDPHVPRRSADENVEYHKLRFESGKALKPRLNQAVVGGIDSPAMRSGKSKPRIRPEQVHHRFRFPSTQRTIPPCNQHSNQPSSHRLRLSNRRSQQ